MAKRLSGRGRPLLCALLCLLLPLTALPARAELPRASQVDVILLLDRSGSMAKNDPQDLAATGARLFLDMLDSGDRVAVIAFDTTARSVLPLSDLGDGAAARQAIDGLGRPAGEWTDIKAALAEGLAALGGQAAPDRQGAVLLFTDGRPEVQPEGVPAGYREEMAETVGRIARRAIPVFTVGLGQADYDTLGEIAATTRGESFAATSPSQVVKLFSEVLSRVKTREVVFSLEEELAPGAVSQPHVFEVPPYTRLLTLSAVGSDVSLQGQTPSGGPLAAAPGLKVSRGGNYVLYSIPNPAPGPWTVRLAGTGRIQGYGQVESARLYPAGVPGPAPVIEPSRWPHYVAAVAALVAGLLGFGAWSWRRIRRRRAVLAGRFGSLSLAGCGREASIGPGPSLTNGGGGLAQATLSARLVPRLWAPLVGLGLGRAELQVYIRPAPGVRLQINGRPAGDGRLHHGDTVAIGADVCTYSNLQLSRRLARKPVHRASGPRRRAGHVGPDL